ncbi:MAG: STT3 domain-containing protein [Conexivisphaerales archaeon]
MIRIRPTAEPKKVSAFLGITIAFALGLMFRIQMSQFGYYLDGFDPYFHYYVTSILVRDLSTQGFAGISNFFSTVDYKAWYPVGLNIATQTYPGMYFTSAFLYEFIKAIGIRMTLYEFLVIEPAFFGALLAIPAYLIGSKLHNGTVGVISALSVAVIPDMLSRTSIGSYRHEPFAILGGMLAIYFIIMSYEENVDSKRSLMYAMVAGLMLGYANIVWGGGMYFNGIAAVSFLLIPLLIPTDYTKCLNAFAVLIVDLSVGMAFPNPGISWLYNATIIAMAAGGSAGLLLTAITKHAKDANKIIDKWVFAIIVSLIGIVSLFTGLVPGLAGKYLVLINPITTAAGAAVHTVAEQQATSGVQFLHTYTVLLFLSVLGGYFALKKKNAASVIMVVTLLSALYFASTYVRLTELLPMPIGVLAGFGTSKLLENEEKDAGKKKLAREARVAMKSVVSILLIFLIAVTAIYVWLPGVVDRGYSITSSATILPGQVYVPAWLQALTWISENTPQNAKIVSWWDYGYWIETMGNRTTFIDGATINSAVMAEVARMFLSNETQAVNIMKDLGGNYVVVFLTLIKVTQSGASYYTLGRVNGIGGDDSKYDAMAAIAGLNDSIFNNAYTDMPNRYFWNNTLLGQLFPLNYVGYGLYDTSTGSFSIEPSYNPSYLGQANMIQIPLYTMQQKYPFGASPFELVFQSSSAPVAGNVIAQVFVYKFDPSNAPA